LCLRSQESSEALSSFILFSILGANVGQGKWTSSDPAGFVDGLNPFVYAKSNPIKLVDTTGMDSGTPKDFQLKMPEPPSGLGPPVGSNIQLMAPLPVPSADFNTPSGQSQVSLNFSGID
jgi:hypothetical protein